MKRFVDREIYEALFYFAALVTRCIRYSLHSLLAAFIPPAAFVPLSKGENAVKCFAQKYIIAIGLDTNKKRLPKPIAFN